jgi:hypothetical protein
MGKAVREATGITIQLAYYFESSQAHLRRNLGYSSIFGSYSPGEAGSDEGC